MNQIKVDRKDFIKQLSGIKDDNVSIADVVIDRRKLVEALKLQTQDGAEVITLTYGNISWNTCEGTREIPVIEHEPCIQFSCNHTIMRFLNRPKYPKNNKCFEPVIKHLNFVNHHTKQSLTGIAVDTQELIEALSFVLHGVATEDSRPVLKCICFNCSTDNIELATADGYRLAVTNVSAKCMTEKQVLIQSKDIVKLLTFLKTNLVGHGKGKYWLDTYIDIRDTEIQFMTEKGKIELQNQDGNYPNYLQLIPDKGTHIQIVASEMLDAVKAAAVSAKDSSGIVRLIFDRYPSKLTVYAKSEESSDTSIECQALVDRECRIAANHRYLIDFLSTCKNRVIDMFIDSPSSPIVFYDTDKRLEVIMPMFVQW